MSAISWISNLWPGLPQLWQRGTWQSLLVAVAFSALLNGALLESFASGVDRSGWLTIGLWVGVLVSILLALLWQMFDQTQLEDSDDGDNESKDHALRIAQAEYLKGHWSAVERRIGQILLDDHQDPEARLLLVATLRRKGRLADASTELSRLAENDRAGRWHVEIHQEMNRLNELAATESDSNEDEPPATLPFPSKAA